MKTKDASRFLAVALAFSVFAISGCGGGGGGGGGTTTATGTKSAGTGATASNSVVSTANTGLSSVANVSGGAPSFKKMGTKEAVSKLYEGLKANQAKVAAMRAGTLKAPLLQNCSGGGTMSTDVTLSGATITGMTMTFTQCTQTGTTTKTYMDGTMSYSETPIGFTWSMSGTPAGTGSFTTRENRISDNLLLSESIMSGSFTGSYGSTSFLSCTDIKGVTYSEPTSITITMNMSGSFKDDFDANGTLDENGTFQMTNFTESVTITKFDLTCNPSAGTLAMSGSMSYTDNIDPNESGSFTIPRTSPLAVTWADATQGGVSGTQVSMSGTITMTAGCFTGSITFNTMTPLFIPDGKDCPTAGVIVITGDISGTVTYTSTGGVEIDEGSNGTVDYRYTTCEGAQACVG